MNIQELQSFRLSDAVKFNDQLNPRLWGSNEHLLPEVREKLMAIADDFREFLGISDLEIKDITISGSNAAYTYTPHSDIDLHLVVDLPKADISDVYRELFDAKKYQYNDQHDYKIGNYDVELYVQDANKPHHSQGIYSLLKNDWVRVPSRRQPTVDDISVKSKFEDIGRRIEQAVASGNKKQMDAIADKVKNMRQAGLDTTGEFGPENLAFKALRTQGLLDQLRQARMAAKDAELSLTEREKARKKKPHRWGKFSGMWFPGFDYYANGNNGSEDVAAETEETVKENTKQENIEDILQRFFNSCVKFLELDNPPTLRIKRDPEWTKRNGTFGRFDPDTNTVMIAVHGRHILDILRTLAHELTHAGQNEQVKGMPVDAGETGSPYEDEANAMAGRIMRHWVDNHPEYFKDIDLTAEDYDPNGPPPGPEFRPTMPAGTVRVDVSDVYDWYKLGQHVSNLKGLGRHDFGQGPPSTIMAFGSEPEEHKYIKDLEKTGLKTTDIDPVDKNQPPGMKRQKVDPTYNVNEASGYIPVNDQEARDPRYSMAITQDIKPGEIKRQAAKLGFTVDAAGIPPLLMERLQKQLDDIKQGISESTSTPEVIDEIKMSPTNLRQQAKGIDALAGMEFEMIVPGVGGSDDSDDMERDYDADERIRRFRDIETFYYDGNYNSRQDAQRLAEKIWEDYQDSDWLSERKQEEWGEVAEDHVRDLVERDYGDEYLEQAEEEVKAQAPEFGMNGEELRQALDDRYKELFLDKVNDIMANMGPEYDAAYEEWEDQEWPEIWNDDDMFTDWASEEGMNMMSDIERSYEITWPYWQSNNSEEEASIEDIASQFENAIGRDVKWSGSYHGAKRDRSSYIVEPDSSLEGDNPGDSGLEFVSPPMPIDELLTDLKKVKAWAKSVGAYTNKTTGLHINVSVPGWQGESDKLDYVKLALLLGDEYVLDQFGRSSNTYAKSALEKVRGNVKRNPDAVGEVLEKMKSNLNALAAKSIHSGITDKYTSINNKNGYIEFRSPGGDWLDDNFDKIENTLLRFVVALDAAVNEDKYKQEYAKKLYKLLEPSNDAADTLQYFTRFSTGELPRSALASFVRQAQLKRKEKKGELAGKRYWWSVTKSDSYAGIEVVAADKEEAIAKAQEQYPEWRYARNISASPVRPYDEPQAQPAAVPTAGSIGQAGQQQPRPNVGTQTDMENRLGWGSQSADANYEIVNRANNRSVFRFIANTPQDAQRKYSDWLAAAGYPDQTEDFGYRPVQ